MSALNCVLCRLVSSFWNISTVTNGKEFLGRVYIMYIWQIAKKSVTSEFTLCSFSVGTGETCGNQATARAGCWRKELDNQNNNKTQQTTRFFVQICFVFVCMTSYYCFATYILFHYCSICHPWLMFTACQEFLTLSTGQCLSFDIYQ